MIALLAFGAALAAGFAGFAAGRASVARNDDGDRAKAWRREAEAQREDAVRWKRRALRRGWRPGQAWRNR